MKIYYFILLFSFYGFSQNYPQNDFFSPLEIPLELSGTFGELRYNHFHSGLDFRTQQKVGLNIISIADGYISRIKISTFGYGKTLYVTHPNGYTSVYAHLEKAVGKIEDFIIKNHYKEQSYEIELFLKPNELPVKQGEIIALSGNSGGSGGPHLHFEIRNSKTEAIINPFLFGFHKWIKDENPPIINSLMVYPMNDNTLINQKFVPLELLTQKTKSGELITSKIKVNGEIGIGINTHDISSKSFGKNGVYKITSYLNGSEYFKVVFDQFSFDESREINYYVDYENWMKTDKKFQKLFNKIPYNLSLTKNNSKGTLEIKPNQFYNYKIEIEDFHQNKIIVNIPIEFEENNSNLTKETKKTNYFVKHNKEYIFEKNNVTIHFRENTFYEDFYLDFEINGNTAKIHEDIISFQKDPLISFKIDTFTQENVSKYFIAEIQQNKIKFLKTKYKDLEFSAYLKNLGTHQLIFDNKNPEIKPLNFKEGDDFTILKKIEFMIQDDLSGIKSYNGFINDKWVLFEYDYKLKKISYFVDNQIFNENKNILKLEILDNVGNSTIFETFFTKNTINELQID
jgi:murein DD-endopeptidase MepM/ murein hydrolase activator NlpD